MNLLPKNITGANLEAKQEVCV